MQLYNGAFPPPTSHPLHPLYAGLVVHGDGDYTDSHAFRQRWAQPAGMSGRQKLALLSLTSPLVAAFALRTTFGIIFLCFLKTFSLCLFFFPSSPSLLSPPTPFFQFLPENPNSTPLFLQSLRYS